MNKALTEIKEDISILEDILKKEKNARLKERKNTQTLPN